MPGAANVAELAVVVSADTSPAEGALGKFGSSLGGVIGLGVASAGAAVAAGVAVGVKAAGDLEQAVANISTIKPEIDNSAVFASLNEMSTRIPQTATQLGESLYNVFSSLDVGAEEGLALVEKFAKGAVGAGTSAETFGTAAMGVMNAYGLSVKDADHISDVFFNTVNKGVITGEELAASLGPVTQSAKAAGVGLDELGAMVAAVTKEGGPAAQNVNNLNNFLQKITTKEAQKQLNDLGVATKTATGEFRPTTDVLEDLKAKLGGMTESARANALQAIFPDAQARIGAQTLLSQLDLVKSATEENRTSSGAAEAAYQKMSATFNSQSKLLMNGLRAILTTIGGMLLPLITPLVTAFSQSLPTAFQAAQEAIAPFIPVIEGVISAIVTGAGVAITAIQSLLTIFSGGEWDESMTAAWESLVNIFGQEGAQVITQFVSTAIDLISGFASGVMELFGQVVDWVRANWPLIQQTIQTVLAAISAFWSDHGEQITEIVTAAWTIVKTVVSGALDGILSAVTIAMQLINGDWSGAWDTFVGLAERNLERIGTIIGAAFDAWYALIDAATGGMLTSISTWLDDTQEAVQRSILQTANAIENGWMSIKSTVAGILPTIASAIMAVWNQIPEDIRTDLTTIATHIVTAGGTWVSNLTTAGGNMLSAVGTALGNMVSAVTTWATSTFIAPVLGLALTTGAAMTTAGSSMLSAITGKLAEIVGALQTWASSTFLAPLQSLASTVGSTAQSIGSAIVNGIISGVRSMGDSLSGVLGSMVRGALSSAKAALGIESPSKVFAAEVGKPIVQGVMAGLDSMSGPLDNALSGLISPPSVSSNMAYSGAGSGSGSLSSAGGAQTIRVDVAVGGRVAEQIWITGYALLARSGGLPSRFGDAP